MGNPKGRVHFPLNCVISRLFSIAKPLSFCLVNQKMAPGSNDSNSVNRPWFDALVQQGNDGIAIDFATGIEWHTIQLDNAPGEHVRRQA
jgi:hypothetical protein